MARVIKTLQNKINKEVGHGFAHRDHRSKKNRKQIDKMTIYKLKRRREEEWMSEE